MKIRARDILLVILLVLALSIQVMGIDTRASFIIVDYGASLSKNANGDLKITFDISTSELATTLGPSSIILQHRQIGTSTWHTATTYTLQAYPELQASGKTFYLSSVSYSSPQSGYEYRAIVAFYASNGTSSDTKPYTTSIWP